MTDLIHQIIDIIKNIASIFQSGILGPLVTIVKSIGLLFVKVLELAIMVVKWIVAQI